jgi:hypothetical protein
MLKNGASPMQSSGSKDELRAIVHVYHELCRNFGLDGSKPDHAGRREHIAAQLVTFTKEGKLQPYKLMAIVRGQEIMRQWRDGERRSHPTR